MNHLTLTLYLDVKNQHRWSLVARNGRCLADSGEGYKKKADMMRVVGVLFPALRIKTIVDSTKPKSGK